MYVAVVADGRVASVDPSEQMALDTMIALKALKYPPKRVVRIKANESAFIDYSNGRELRYLRPESGVENNSQILFDTRHP